MTDSNENVVRKETYLPDELSRDQAFYDVFSSQRRFGSMGVSVTSCAFVFLLVLFVRYVSQSDQLFRLLLADGTLLGAVVPMSITFCASWCFVFGVGRWRKFSQEHSVLRDKEFREMLLSFRSANRAEVLVSFKSLPPRFRGIGYYRILSLLEQFVEINDGLDLAKNRWRLEKERVGGDYVVPNVMVWAMPILGFIGTVVGISSAIGEFSTFLGVTGNQVDIGLIKERLADVANGLAFAFDTTLLGLVGSVIGVLFLSVSRRMESDFFVRLDYLCLALIEARHCIDGKKLSRLVGEDQ